MAKKIIIYLIVVALIIFLTPIAVYWVFNQKLDLPRTITLSNSETEKTVDNKNEPLQSNQAGEKPDFAGEESYQWGSVSFKYPVGWQVEEIYYQTAAQEAEGLAKEIIGVKIFKDKASEADFIAIGGHQVSCDESERHTRCQFIKSISDFVYTDSKDSDILNYFESLVKDMD